MDSNIEKQLIALRPNIPQASINASTSKNESFQNITLRPIIKFLSEHVLSITKTTILQYNKSFGSLTFEKKVDALRTLLEKNQKIRLNLCGMVIGFMTLEELETYHQSSSEHNKRILQMMEQRIVDHIEYFK